MSCSRPAALVLALLAAFVLPTAAVAGDLFADLLVTKTDSPDPVLAGANLTYTITLSNEGNATGTTTLTDGIPAQATFVSFTAPAGWTATTPAVGGTGTVMASNPAFAPGISAVFTLVVRANSNLGNGATITNTASATTPADPDGGSDTEQTAVNTQADLVVTKTDSPDPVVAGTNLTYTLTFSNEGPSDSQNATLSDAIPAGTTFVSVTQTGGPAFTLTTPPSGGTGTFSATIPAGLAAGASATFELVVHVDPGAPTATPISNTATVGSVVTTDPDLVDNSDTEETAVIAQADLAIAKTDSPDPVAAGTDLTYTLTVTNAGPSDAASVSLTDPIPAGTTFVSASQTSGPAFVLSTPPAGSGGTFSAMAATFAAGETVTFTLAVRVDPATPPGSSIVNTAAVSAATTDPGPGVNTVTVATTTSAGTAVPPIPTLSEWMMALLAAALAAVALRSLR